VSDDNRIALDNKLTVLRYTFVPDMKDNNALRRLIEFAPVRKDNDGLRKVDVYGRGLLPYDKRTVRNFGLDEPVS
jgi:hypothetical protein